MGQRQALSHESNLFYNGNLWRNFSAVHRERRCAGLTYLMTTSPSITCKDALLCITTRR
jgi:hypothetical protein